MNLPNRFEQGDGGGGGEVEAAFARGLGNADDAAGMVGEEGIGDAGGFVAEDQPVAVGEPGLPEGRLALGGKEPEGRDIAAEGIEESVGIVVNGQSKPGPVVQRAAAEIFVVEDEAERADEVKLG